MSDDIKLTVTLDPFSDAGEQVYKANLEYLFEQESIPLQLDIVRDNVVLIFNDFNADFFRAIPLGDVISDRLLFDDDLSRDDLEHAASSAEKIADELERQAKRLRDQIAKLLDR